MAAVITGHPSSPAQPGYPTDEAALRDLWDIYDGQYDAISAAMASAAEADPVLRLAMPRIRALGGSREAARGLVRAGMVTGDWEPHREALDTTGARYAQEDISFALWLATAHAFRVAARERLLAAYGTDSGRLVRCLCALEDFLDASMAVVANAYWREREANLDEERRVRELSTPVLPLRPGLLVLPFIGDLDAERARHLTGHLLAAIRQHRARVVVIDVTGVFAMDSAVVNHLLKSVSAARLMGAQAILSGLSAGNAAALARAGLRLPGLVTARDLEDGIRQADRLLQAPAG